MNLMKFLLASAAAALALGGLAETGRTTAASMNSFRRALRREDPVCAAARLDAAAWKRTDRAWRIRRHAEAGAYGMPVAVLGGVRGYVPNYPINAARLYHLKASGV